MSKVDNGGPAFPTPQDEFGRNSASMSLRDWFAGQYLAGNPWICNSLDEFAAAAYEAADAMLSARKRSQP